ncbi:MAG: hypothetical protein AB9869_12495 [Verrucomicrobiia bacterium]
MKTHFSAPAFSTRTGLVVPARMLALWLLALSALLLTGTARAAELHGVMDLGFLNLSWDAPDAKLEEAPKPAGPWQTVITTGSPYRLRPSVSKSAPSDTPSVTATAKSSIR